MNNVFILHGTFGKPFENWNQWLDSELSKNGIISTVPHFPTPNLQNYDSWKSILDVYKSIGLLNEGSILVGHSSAAIFIARYLIDTNTRINGFISVSGFNNFISGLDEFDNLNKNFFMDDKELSQVTNYAAKVIGIYSDNDPYLPLAKLEEFIKIIDGEYILIKNGGHFNTDGGFDSFPRLFEIIVDLIP